MKIQISLAELELILQILHLSWTMYLPHVRPATHYQIDLTGVRIGTTNTPLYDEVPEILRPYLGTSAILYQNKLTLYVPNIGT